MVELSIVIPVYNVAKYLNQCIDSIIRQDIINCEIILIDDGSADQSGIICDKYGKNIKYLKVIHKINGGLSSARNTGIIASSGHYIMFMDSDDWLNSYICVNDLINRVNIDAEMVLFSSLEYFEEKGIFIRTEHENLKSIRTDSIDNYYYDLLHNGNLEVSAWAKLFTRDFLINNNLYFKLGMLGEDNEWMIRVLRKLSKVEIIDIPLYVVRRERIGSISNTIKEKSISDLLDIVFEILNDNSDNHLKKYELDFCSYLWFCALGLSNQLNNEEFHNLKNQFLLCSNVCKYSSSPKTRLAFYAVRITGFYTARKILGFYIWLKKKSGMFLKKISNN